MYRKLLNFKYFNFFFYLTIVNGLMAYKSYKKIKVDLIDNLMDINLMDNIDNIQPPLGM